MTGRLTSSVGQYNNNSFFFLIFLGVFLLFGRKVAIHFMVMMSCGLKNVHELVRYFSSVLVMMVVIFLNSYRPPVSPFLKREFRRLRVSSTSLTAALCDCRNPNGVLGSMLLAAAQSSKLMVCRCPSGPFKCGT